MATHYTHGPHYIQSAIRNYLWQYLLADLENNPSSAIRILNPNLYDFPHLVSLSWKSCMLSTSRSVPALKIDCSFIRNWLIYKKFFQSSNAPHARTTYLPGEPTGSPRRRIWGWDQWGYQRMYDLFKGWSRILACIHYPFSSNLSHFKNDNHLYLWTEHPG